MGKKGIIDRQSLIDRFAEAGLKLELAKEPIQRLDNADVFQLDIPRKLKGNTRQEWFRIWPGHEDNLIIVQNIDKKLMQLVLMVREAKRTFTRETHFTRLEWDRMKDKPKIGGYWMREKVVNLLGAAGDSRFLKGVRVVTEQVTTEAKRHYLCGVDERQLFICQLKRGCSTVADAHNSLRRTELTLAEGKTLGKTIRQGEWFFVNLTEGEKDTLEKVLAKAPYLLHKKEAIGAGGNPHTAEEIVRMPGIPLLHGYPIRMNVVYVRGSVTHVDHAPVRFAQWRRVIRNNELGSDDANPPGRGRGGVYWID
jgi:hypothetical protein